MIKNRNIRVHPVSICGLEEFVEAANNVPGYGYSRRARKNRRCLFPLVVSSTVLTPDAPMLAG